MDDTLRLGSKVRQLRRRESLTQVQLASRLGISASYLNLIERNRRPLPAPLLIKLAQLCQVDIAEFAAENDARLIPDLTEVFADPVFEGTVVLPQDLEEVVTASPPVARAVITLYEAYRAARTTSGRDASEPGRGGDEAATIDLARLSSEEVSDFIQRRFNHFPELEVAAEQLWKDARLDRNDIGPGLVQHLARRLGVDVRFVAVGDAERATRRFDAHARRVTLSELLPPRSRNFQLAHQICLLTHGEVLARYTRDDRLTTDESRALCRIALANYFAGAVLMPYAPFWEAARRLRYDVELLGHRFRTSYEQVTQRLTTLQRPGCEGVPFHFIRVDVAGNISKRFSASGIRFARFSGACPRWNVFSAFLTPGRIRAQLSVMPDGTVYFCFARTVNKGVGGWHGAHALHAIGLGCRLEHARDLVYSDGMALEDLKAALPVGVTCRLCERMDCEQRAFPSSRHPLRMDENVRGVSFYAPVDAALPPPTTTSR
ncbi:short-chain fatty acyl-CoA regulator family protein [Myxococcota bacterium]|nr:short-chain fatty acyl-CoA regulator family protein [Myxococcota bacterium]